MSPPPSELGCVRNGSRLRPGLTHSFSLGLFVYAAAFCVVADARLAMEALQDRESAKSSKEFLWTIHTAGIDAKSMAWPRGVCILQWWTIPVAISRQHVADGGIFCVGTTRGMMGKWFCKPGLGLVDTKGKDIPDRMVVDEMNAMFRGHRVFLWRGGGAGFEPMTALGRILSRISPGRFSQSTTAGSRVPSWRGGLPFGRSQACKRLSDRRAPMTRV